MVGQDLGFKYSRFVNRNIDTMFSLRLTGTQADVVNTTLS